MIDGAAPDVTYALPERTVRTRARATAALESFGTLMPPLLVLTLVAQLGFARPLYVTPVVLLLVTLAVARGVVNYRAALRRLRLFEVAVDASRVTVRTVRATFAIPRADVARVLEIDGALGGLRLEIAGKGDVPPRIDVPRGGVRYPELRLALAASHPIERAPQRRARTRVLLGAFVVLAIFFMPFVMADLVASSRAAACALILVAWLAMRAALKRA